MQKISRILLTGGGSGGHISPNLAVASAIQDKDPDIELLYIASKNKLDADLLKPSGIPFSQIYSGKLRRYFSWRNFIDPIFVLFGFIQSLSIILRFRPQVIFSKGGYVSLPVVIAAWVLRKKIILHESDSRMGIANRISAKLASKVCIAFPELEKLGKKYVLTGNPIRKKIANGDMEKGYQFTGFSSELPVILVWGGSQGAKQINELIHESFHHFTEFFQIIHITGAGKGIDKESENYINFDYLDEELRNVYAITDMVIGRAGANSLYEVAYHKKPNIIIPLKNADQLSNAKFFEEIGASITYRDGADLFALVSNLWQNNALKAEMRSELEKLSKPHATEEIVKIILDS